MDEDEGSEAHVELVIPGDPRFLRVARMAAASVATVGGFDVDAVDDLRIGVDELCSLLLDQGDGDLTLRFSVTRSRLVVNGRCRARHDLPEGGRSTLAQQILAVVADRYEVAVVDGDLVFVLEKRSGAAGGS